MPNIIFSSNGLFPRKARIRFSLLAVLLFVSVVCLVLGWIFRPISYVAEANLQIRYLSSGYDPDREYIIYRNTQQALITSPFVLDNALARSDIAGLACLANREDPVKWLQENLDVSFPSNGEVMKVTLIGGENSMPDYCRLIDAIIESYIQEVGFKELTRRSERMETRRGEFKVIQNDLEDKIQQLKNLDVSGDDKSPKVIAKELMLKAKIEALTSLAKELQMQLFEEQSQNNLQEQRIRILNPATSSRL